MQRLRVYGCFTGETGEPKRLDLNEDGTFRLELHGGQMLAGSVREISPAHKVVTKDEEGNDVEGYEGEKLTLKPASPQKEAMTATMKDGGWFVELLGVSMQKTVCARRRIQSKRNLATVPPPFPHRFPAVFPTAARRR